MRLCSPPTSPPGFSALSVSFSPKPRPSHTRSLHGQSELPQVLGRCRTRARRSRSPLPATAFNTRLACRARVVHPDGAGLPVGSGTPAEGAKIYVAKCALCHGQDGKGSAESPTPLIGGGPITDISASMKTISNFWPYATTVFDYIRRAMPWQQPMTLTNDEVYALTAYILAANKLIGENNTLSAETLPKVRMPNRDGFIIRFPDLIQ